MKGREAKVQEESDAPADFHLERSQGRFDRADHWLQQAGSTILTAMFLVMTTVGLMQVVFRYFFQLPLPWSEELIRYLFVWTTFLGAGVAAAQGLHIEIDLLSFILDNRTPAQRARTIRQIRIAGTFLVLIFLAYYDYLAAGFLWDIKELEQTSTAMDMNMLWPMSSILVGGGLMFFHYCARIVRDLQAVWTERAAAGVPARRTS